MGHHLDAISHALSTQSRLLKHLLRGMKITKVQPKSVLELQKAKRIKQVGTILIRAFPAQAENGKLQFDFKSLVSGIRGRNKKLPAEIALQIHAIFIYKWVSEVLNLSCSTDYRGSPGTDVDKTSDCQFK